MNESPWGRKDKVNRGIGNAEDTAFNDALLIRSFAALSLESLSFVIQFSYVMPSICCVKNETKLININRYNVSSLRLPPHFFPR